MWPLIIYYHLSAAWGKHFKMLLLWKHSQTLGKNTGENPSKTLIIHPDKSSVSQICFIIFHQDLWDFAEPLNQQNKRKKMKEVCLLHLTETRCRVDLQHSFSSMLSKTSSGLSLFVGQPHVAYPLNRAVNASACFIKRIKTTPSKTCWIASGICMNRMKLHS